MTDENLHDIFLEKKGRLFFFSFWVELMIRTAKIIRLQWTDREINHLQRYKSKRNNFILTKKNLNEEFSALYLN